MRGERGRQRGERAAVARLLASVVAATRSAGGGVWALVGGTRAATWILAVVLPTMVGQGLGHATRLYGASITALIIV